MHTGESIESKYDAVDRLPEPTRACIIYSHRSTCLCTIRVRPAKPHQRWRVIGLPISRRRCRLSRLISDNLVSVARQTDTVNQHGRQTYDRSAPKYLPAAGVD